MKKKKSFFSNFAASATRVTFFHSFILGAAVSASGLTAERSKVTVSASRS